MISFKQYLSELTKPSGNYVALDATDQTNWFIVNGFPEPKSGKAPPLGDFHCTLMYSENTAIPPNKALKLDLGTVSASVTGIGCFDGLNDDKTSKSCLVLQLFSPVLEQLHKSLSDLGMVHSYKEFNPHITLRYNMDVNEAHVFRDMINGSGKKFADIQLSNMRSESINKNYV